MIERKSLTQERCMELPASYDRAVAERLLQLLEERDADLAIALATVVSLTSERDKLKKEFDALHEASHDKGKPLKKAAWHCMKAANRGLERSREEHRVKAVVYEAERDAARRVACALAQEIRDCTLENAKLAELEASHPWLLEEEK